MKFEIETLNERIDATGNEVWKIISMFWQAYQLPSQISAFFLKESETTDIRNIKREKGVFFDGILIEIEFIKEKNKLILFGVSSIGEGRFSRYEHILGTIEVNPMHKTTDSPVDVKIICQWEPFYMCFLDMAKTVLSEFKQQKINEAFSELIEFKKFIERQAYEDIYVKGKPQENIARALLQSFLSSRSYREIPVKGGKSDILVFDKEGRYLYETKIWRGQKYYRQGIDEIKEYILGEDDDNKLDATFYVIFDPTKTSAAREYLTSDISYEIVENRTVRIILININPKQPSNQEYFN